MPVKLEASPERNAGYSGTLAYKSVLKSAPFCVSVHGHLMHRVRYVQKWYENGRYRNTHVDLWCGNGFNRVELIEKPDGSRLLCERCEAVARAAGEKPADTLAGRHIHTGRIVIQRTCCKRESN